MDGSHYLTCFWPGLPELWWRGRLASLPTAIGFGLVLNAFLVFGWVYPGLLPKGLFWIGALIGGIVWLYYVIRSFRALPELIHPRRASDQPDRFGEAHQAYLRANWVGAEKILTSVLAIEPRDPPALLMLSSVYRHQGRLQHAELLLNEVGRVEVADAWWVEIDIERKKLRRAIARKQENDQDDEHGFADGSEEIAAEMTASRAAAA